MIGGLIKFLSLGQIRNLLRQCLTELNFFLFQYLFPDAAVVKASGTCKTKAAQTTNPLGKAEQDKNSDSVC